MIDAGRRAARNSIGDALRRVTAKNSTKPALIWKDRSWTFESLETASLRVAERLAALGLRKGDRVAYAQWEDAGPFRTDHWEYVFGNERPKPNLNHGAGLDADPRREDHELLDRHPGGDLAVPGKMDGLRGQHGDALGQEMRAAALLLRATARLPRNALR